MNKVKLGFVFVFLCCASTGYGLKCYQCISTKSWYDCAAVKVVNYCAFGQERCYYAVSSHKKKGRSIEVFYKGCLTAAQCEHGYLESFCKKQKGFGCTGYCCSGDLCNGGALPMVKNTGTNNRALGLVFSVIVLFACAKAAFVR